MTGGDTMNKIAVHRGRYPDDTRATIRYVERFDGWRATKLAVDVSREMLDRPVHIPHMMDGVAI
jgi:hypothetical protein